MKDNDNERDPSRKSERNAIRKTLNDGAPVAVYAEVAKLRRTNKAKLDLYLTDLYHVLHPEAYWVYEEACEAGGFCG